MKENRLRQLLRAGRPTLGTRLNTVSPELIEMLGHTGLYDYVELVGENAPYDLRDLNDCCRAAELHGLGTVFKTDNAGRRFLAQRAVGAGFEGVLFADGRSLEDAREAVRLCRAETPGEGGTFGVINRRFSYPEFGGSPRYVQLLRDVVVMLMVEKREFVECLDAVLAVPGIDMIQWGGADFSLSAGRPGGVASPETKQAELQVIKAALKAGVPPRVELGSAEQAPYYLELGVRHFSIGLDTRTLYDAWKGNGEKARKLLASL